ncbi:MAG: pantetheine-phosphate adenylyltransferase [Flavobacteriales bacterium]|nr:pantetheine-phosphate adenylyltransferase [Flavobacteriales bacterium]
MKRTAVFPGSFDPITRGHENIVRRAALLFDEIVVAIGINTTKEAMFPLKKRKQWLEKVFADLVNVRIETYQGLTVDFCKKTGAGYLLRGLRNGGDFEYECTIAQTNKSMASELETVLLFSDPQFASIHSTLVREIAKNQGDVSMFIPAQINIHE